jgi:hypothetical protein
MKIRALVAGVVLAWTVFGNAQSMPSTTVCLAKIEGSEAVNWNLRPPIEKSLTRKIGDENLNATVVLLEAKSPKQSVSEADEKKCSLVVYSQIDRKTGDVNSMMNPSIYQRGTANVDSTTGSSTLRYGLKIKDAKRKKVADEKVDVELEANFGPKEFEDRGRVMVDGVVNKIVSVIKQQLSPAQ